MYYKVNCSVCQASRGNPKLRARIYAAWYKQDEGDERLAHIAQERGFTLASIYNHAKKHMTADPVSTPKRVEGHIERLKAKIAKETELALEHGTIVPKEDFEEAIDGVIAEGLAELKRSDKSVTVNQLLAAAKIKADYSAKKRGQDTEVIKTFLMASTGLKQNEPTNPTTNQNPITV